MDAAVRARSRYAFSLLDDGYKILLGSDLLDQPLRTTKEAVDRVGVGLRSSANFEVSLMSVIESLPPSPNMRHRLDKVIWTRRLLP